MIRYGWVDSDCDQKTRGQVLGHDAGNVDWGAAILGNLTYSQQHDAERWDDQMAKRFCLYWFDCYEPGYLEPAQKLGLHIPQHVERGNVPTSFCGWIQQQECVGKGVVDVCCHVREAGVVTRGRHLDRRPRRKIVTQSYAEGLRVGIHSLALE